MSKTYWSQRIEELANSEKAVPDTAFSHRKRTAATQKPQQRI